MSTLAVRAAGALASAVSQKPPARAELPHAARRPALGAAWRACAGAIAFYRRRRQINRTVAALSQLSDHLLKDIGLHRGQILGIARSGRDEVHNRT